MNHVRTVKMLPALLGLSVLAFLAGGCANYFQQAHVQSKSLDREELDQAPGTMTESALREEVLRFASRYMSAVGEFGVERVEDAESPPEERLAALRLAHSLNTSALEISIGRSPRRESARHDGVDLSDPAARRDPNGCGAASTGART